MTQGAWSTDYMRKVVLHGAAPDQDSPALRLLLLAARHENALPDEVVDGMVALLEDPEIQRAPHASELISAIEGSWDDVSPKGRTRLVDALERAYPMWADWMACFTTTEMLGMQIGGAASLDMMRRLRDRSTGHALELIPHGFEHLAADSKDPQLARAALAGLVAMGEHPSPEVRGEVQVSLSRLRARVATDPDHPVAGILDGKAGLPTRTIMRKL